MAVKIVVPAPSFTNELSLLDETFLRHEADHETGVRALVGPYFAILREAGIGTSKAESEALTKAWRDRCLQDFGLRSMWDEESKKALLVQTLVDGGKSKAKAEAEIANRAVHVRTRDYVESIGLSVLRYHLYADQAAAQKVELNFTLGLFTKSAWVPKWDKEGKLLPCKALEVTAEGTTEGTAKAAGPSTVKRPTKKKAEEAMDAAVEGFVLLGGDYAKAAGEIAKVLISHKIRTPDAE